MKLINFVLKDQIYLVQGDLELDLHNDYDFIEYKYDVVRRNAILKWKKTKGDWVVKGIPGYIKIEISEIFYFSVTPRSPEVPYTEDVCLDDVSFETDEEWADGPF